MHRIPTKNRHKIGQGRHKVMIYINFLLLETLMVPAKFQDHRTSGSNFFKFFNHIHLYMHVSILVNCTNFHTPLPLTEAPHKFGFNQLIDQELSEMFEHCE